MPSTAPKENSPAPADPLPPSPLRPGVPPPNLVLSGETALVTGASRGIGRATARQLGRLGASVAICARNREELELTAAALRDEGISTLPIVADVTRAADVEKLVEQASGKLGAIGIV